MQVSVIDCHPALAITSVSASLAKDAVSVSSYTGTASFLIFLFSIYIFYSRI